jgi:CHAD domain-containing protein
MPIAASKDAESWPERCRARLAAAVRTAASRFPTPGHDDTDSIHATRRALKEARALMRFLTRAGDLDLTEPMRGLDHARSALATTRDFDVMASALGDLREATSPRTADAFARSIEARRLAARVQPTDARRNIAALRRAARQIEALDLSSWSARDLTTALRALWRRARRRGERAFETADAGHLHRARVAMVELGVVIEMFRSEESRTLAAAMRDLRKLRAMLGDHNDLDVLKGFARGVGLTRPEAEAVERWARERQKPLRRRARRRFEAAFLERPNALVRRLKDTIEQGSERRHG